jgi:2-oxoglutarate ferredoxin oxidoreductase subunit alpha
MSHVAYDPEINQEGIRARSLKLATFQKTLRTPPLFGDGDGDLLIVGWGSTKGAIEEAVERVRAEGHKVSSMHLKFLQPMASGIKDVFSRFNKVMTVENDSCDVRESGTIDDENRRYSDLAWLLRARFLIDVDCWGEDRGQPLKPGTIAQAIRDKLA